MGQVVSIALKSDLVGLHSTALSPADQPSGASELQTVQGRFVELSGQAHSATLSVAMQWVLATQKQGELAAWIQTQSSQFYPPDAAEAGIDLSAFPVVTMATPQAATRAAEHLLRSGAFALLIVDLGHADLTMAAQSRLLGLAQKHHSALVCLTDKSPEASSLGSLVSLRMHTHRQKLAGAKFAVGCSVLKDKRKGPGAQTNKVFHGPAGVR